MNIRTVLIFVGLLTIVVIFLKKKTKASTYSTGSIPTPEPTVPEPTITDKKDAEYMSLMTDSMKYLGMNQWFSPLSHQQKMNLATFCDVISYAEGTHPDILKEKGYTWANGWNVQQSYKKLNLNAKHPEFGEAVGKAVGRFQIEGATWKQFAKGDCINKIVPECQTQIFIDILKGEHTYKTCKTIVSNGKKKRVCTTKSSRQAASAYDDVLAGRFVDALKKLNGRYSSLPESSSPSDRLKTYSDFIKFITMRGGVYIKGVLG